ncbi:hypothetical protein HPP92_013773 [Vanilla planifolia]|uniref:Uncharacterized protein n=1 Tax=Vanilla planifolia TaxID=51239 RepID=A0A835QZ61_VANPL|nr:hypothetical protein HPP92_026496 [Vanilla planifolia]KAG0479054.1 hypothetical protein HPP92_013773 [Vanilla planifolia]
MEKATNALFSVSREPSPSKQRSTSQSPVWRAATMVGLLIPRRWKRSEQAAPAMSGREVLAPVVEGPDSGEDWWGEDERKGGWGEWLLAQLGKAQVATGLHRQSDMRLLLGVMGAPLAPVHVSTGEPLPHLSVKNTPIETSSAQYILQQYIAASGGRKLLSSIHNSYAMGKVRMVASEFETSSKLLKNRNAWRDAEPGCFVLWQMTPDMWYVELSIGASKIHAGCNGKKVWRHTPWLGAHAAKGPIRPLRRALQGLDPMAIASMFVTAQCIGEKEVRGKNCFVLKLCADPQTLKSRSEGPAEVIRHVLFGYFCQKTGLLIHIEDSHLTRIQSNSGIEAVYWETTISSFFDDYEPVEGVMIAHSGRSTVTLLRFGEVAMNHSKTRMEEQWTVEEVAFNVRGLSVDCFIPPALVSETSSLAGGCT